jgi:putative ABC transport system substrate-binding protein
VSTLAAVHRELIGTVAARHHLPAVYGLRYFVASGGLLSYGPDTITPMRRAAGYIDRILKGEKPADLPVQHPTKYELAVNLKTAEAAVPGCPRSGRVLEDNRTNPRTPLNQSADHAIKAW